MSQEKTGPDATPRIGLDLGRQIFDEPAQGARQEGQAGMDEESIRRRAYEIWEREGRSGDPQDHWYRARRELSDAPQKQPEPSSEDTAPGSATPAIAQVGNRKVPRPKKVSNRSVPDDTDE